MADVIEVLDSQMQKEAMNKSFIIWKYRSMIYYQLFVINNFFNNINNLIKKYFFLHIIEEVYKQICKFILYKYEKISLEDI